MPRVFTTIFVVGLLLPLTILLVSYCLQSGLSGGKMIWLGALLIFSAMITLGIYNGKKSK